MESTINTSLIAYRPAGQFEDTRFEKIHNVIVKNSLEGSIEVAKEIATLIREKEKQNKPYIKVGLV
jgi:glucosamine-6-phosphate deaminase